MMQNIEELADVVTRLPVADRAFLAERLLATLDDADLEQGWADEAIRRRDEIRSGRAQPIEAEEVYRRIDALLK